VPLETDLDRGADQRIVVDDENMRYAGLPRSSVLRWPAGRWIMLQANPPLLLGPEPNPVRVLGSPDLLECRSGKA
jgi:hypothetical protein